MYSSHFRQATLDSWKLIENVLNVTYVTSFISMKQDLSQSVQLGKTLDFEKGLWSFLPPSKIGLSVCFTAEMNRGIHS